MPRCIMLNPQVCDLRSTSRHLTTTAIYTYADKLQNALIILGEDSLLFNIDKTSLCGSFSENCNEKLHSSYRCS